MNWFKLYAEFASDPKVQAMPEPMQRRLVMLFCLQCNGALETLDDEELALAMRITPKELDKTRETFRRKGFIAEGWVPRNWDKRQEPADRTAAERMRRYREGLRNKDRNVTANVARNAIRNGATVTALDGETEEEEKTPPIIPPSGGMCDSVHETLQERSAEGPAEATAGTSKPKRARKPKDATPFQRPDWIPAEPWEAFVEMRRKLRKEPTDYACSLIAKELDRLRGLGQSPEAVLQQSIRNSWQDVFSIRNPGLRDESSPPFRFHTKGDFDR